MKLTSSLLSSCLALFVAGCTHPVAAPPRTEPLEGDRERESDEAHPHGVVVRWAQRRNSDGTVPPDAVVRMKHQRDAMLAQQVESAPLLSNWKWLGPGNIGGRIRAICIHPTTPSIMWVGSVGGGIWKTTNGGASWQPLDDFAPMMSVGCMVLDPADPNHLFAGTGEGFFDTLAGSSNLAASRGAGIFESKDGGSTWTRMPSTAGSAFHFVNRIAISPKDNKVMLVATMDGIYRTTDAGATFSKRTSDFAFDVRFHPTDDKQAIAGVRDGVPRYSTDGGLTWSNASGVPWRQRSEVRYAQGSPATVYAAVSFNNRVTVYRSTDGGRSYALRTTGSGISTYSRYNNVLWVDPSDANHILVGGVRLYKSTNAGASFVNAYSGSYYDYHVFATHPGYNGTTNQTVFHGNDAGIYRTTAVKAGSIRWQELNNNLGITQFYGAAMAPNGTVLGGTQDNGTLRYTGNSEGWQRVLGGDGSFCAADPTNSNVMYGQIYGIRIYRSTNNGRSFSQVGTSSKIPDRGPNFMPHITLDPNNPNRLWFAGASAWRSDNIKGSATFVEAKPRINCSDQGGGSGSSHFALDPPCNVSVIQVAKGNSNLVWVGHNHGHLYRSTNALAANPGWTRVDTANLPDRWVGSIAIDPRDHNTVYVSFLGYQRNNVWVTRNAGTSWTRITGSGAGALPESPVNWITVHPAVSGCLLAGTDIGLFYSSDDGQSWSTTAEGSTTAPVQELAWRPDNRTVMVVTHGRGIFTVEVGTRASVRTLSGGCGVPGKPLLTATPPVVGQTQTYTMTGAASSRPVTLLFDGLPTSVPIGNGCTLRVGPAAVLIGAGQTDASGSWTYRINVPRTKEVIGAQATIQAAVLRATGPALGVADLSDAVEVTGGL